jgi:ribulose-phosphate 3-epimerase
MTTTDLVAGLAKGAPNLSVGILTANLGALDEELRLLERGGAPMVHTDVMDGVFCPMLTVGAPFVAAQRTSVLKDVHLMIDEPLEKLTPFIRAGADMITFQVESARNPHRVLQALGGAVNANDSSRGIARGVAISPGTPLEVLEPLLRDLDYVLLLAVNPGWSGQEFAASIPARLARVRSMAAASGRPILVGVDGAVTRASIASVAALRPDIIVSGSAIFDGKAPAANLAFMQEAVAVHRA